MTSDSKADYKYSAIDRPIAKADNIPSTCSDGELRCINGHCITISQLCDKVLLISNRLYTGIFMYANNKSIHYHYDYITFESIESSINSGETVGNLSLFSFSI